MLRSWGEITPFTGFKGVLMVPFLFPFTCVYAGTCMHTVCRLSFIYLAGK